VAKASPEGLADGLSVVAGMAVGGSFLRAQKTWFSSHRDKGNHAPGED
jgi:hypothetical protein